jgi:CRISPR system Cascade subunit CasC
VFVEVHLLQNFVPSNLNRDDTGSPKDCEFGGYRRARISSQCLKRSIRKAFGDERLVAEERLAKRTKRLVDEVAGRLTEANRPEAEARAAVELLLKGVKLAVDDEGETQYLLFLGNAEIAAIAEVCATHWDALAAAAASEAAPEEAGRGGARRAKTQAKETVPPAARQALERVLNGGKAADLALFGRMLADLPDKNLDAACQVAHAISTNRVNVEFDFFTAVDDLKPRSEDMGAGMLGTVEFNSACFYRYANIELEQLKRNLDGDEELARGTVEAFVRASIAAIPTGKQNSMAAQNPPSLVLAVVRRTGLWSLANAFLKPVAPRGERDLVQLSVAALDDYWRKLMRMYGEDGIAGAWVALLDDDGDDGLSALRPGKVANVGALVGNVVGALAFDGARAR